MGAFIASNHEATTLRIRELLMSDGIGCPSSRIESLESATAQQTKLRSDLIIVVLSPDIRHGLNTVQQIRRRTQAPIISIGPIHDPVLILHAIRLGSDEFLDETQLDTELPGALQRLAALRSPSLEPGKMVAIIGTSGGCGSSTVAVNLAASVCKKHGRCGLVDMHLQKGDLAALLNIRPSYTLADLCRNSEALDYELFDKIAAHHPSGIQLLSAPLEYDDIEYITLDGLRRGLHMARERFENVVVDLPHHVTAEEAEIARMADHLVLVLRLDFNSLRSTLKTVDYFTALGISRERIQIVVNRFGLPKELPFAKAESVLGQSIAHFIPDDARIVNASSNEGSPVVLRSPRSKVGQSLAELGTRLGFLETATERLMATRRELPLLTVQGGSSTTEFSREVATRRNSMTQWLGNLIPMGRKANAA